MYSIEPTLSKAYPQGSIGPDDGHGNYLGQCAEFADHCVNIPGGSIGVGLQDKINTVNSIGIPASKLNGDIRVGDVVVWNIGEFGHVSIDNTDAGNNFQNSESNYLLPLRVDHTRITSKTDSRIIGVIRSTLKIPILSPSVMITE